jgi:hypothetical protein
MEEKPVQYMLLIYLEETGLSEEQRAHCYHESALFAQELAASGKYVSAAPLHPTATATSVRTRDGRRLITDGPFAETREQLGGFFMIEANDLDEAIDIASRVPAGRWGTVEVRPVIGVPELPEKSSVRPVDLAGSRSTH